MDKVHMEEGLARVWQLRLREGGETRTASLPRVGFIIPTAQKGLRNLCRSPG